MTRPTPAIWNHVLSLMAAIIIADENVLEDEIQSFIKNARRMIQELNQNSVFSDDLMRNWFDTKRDQIAKEISGGNADAFIVQNIIALEAFAPKQTLFNCLISIAASDAEIHYKEADLINLAAAYWDLSPIKGGSA